MKKLDRNTKDDFLRDLKKVEQELKTIESKAKLPPGISSHANNAYRLVHRVRRDIEETEPQE